MKTFLRTATLAPLLVLVGCAGPQPNISTSTNSVADPVPAIDAGAMLDHIKVLSSDAYEGRAPGGKGEAMTVAYISRQFKMMGLAPGNPDGTFFQRVPMLGAQTKPALSFSVPGKSIVLRASDDFVALTPLRQPEVAVDQSDLVFVGYGVVAPEYGWDDYKGMDLRGKTLVMLINDPPVPDPTNPAELDPNMFGGKTMTYYGRSTYKYEMAARLGAAAAIIVDETKPAAIPFDMLRNGSGSGRFFIRSNSVSTDYPAVASWITVERAKELFAASGKDFYALKAAALSKSFRPVPLGATASFKLQNTQRDLESSNVVARIEGSDPALKNESIIYSAHWDHLGIDEKLPGERSRQIYHGALDNASGVATLLEIARAYKALPVAPKRSILFIATTAEERNLLGAHYYALHPLYPLEKTLVNINIDVANPYGRTSNIVLIGGGKSSADDVVARVAARQGRTVIPDQFPQGGYLYRADQFEFAKVGVPFVYTKWGGTIFVGKPAAFGRDKAVAYLTHAYHKVDDVVQPDWDLAGAVEDAQLLFGVGYGVAQGATFPAWRTTSEFQRPTSMR